MSSFSVQRGYRDLSEVANVVAVFLTIVLAIIAHWVWSVLVAGLPNQKFDFGPTTVWIARIVISFIAAAFSFVGIFTNVKDVGQATRYFAAFTYGFAVDALTGPVVDAATNTGTAAG